MSPEERKTIIRLTAQFRQGDMKIFFCCTGNNTDTTINYMRYAQDNGADGTIIAAPQPISAHRKAISKAISLKWHMPPICRS
ncbi:MAG: dihydrodipicolinate synthase family protein [Symbiopectobacterium sp.]